MSTQEPVLHPERSDSQSDSTEYCVKQIVILTGTLGKLKDKNERLFWNVSFFKLVIGIIM